MADDVQGCSPWVVGGRAFWAGGMPLMGLGPQQHAARVSGDQPRLRHTHHLHATIRCLTMLTKLHDLQDTGQFSLAHQLTTLTAGLVLTA